ncbi:MAG: transglutaminase family protein [Chitinophagaceae bacterium]|nr:transglutaminase family protein [Bacteroidota bacterium]MCC6258094.1 transglutaminase family protein [Chitinophagaceae bacterium]MCW5917236.1 transglutaminase family protein [Ferruginibacter sp.]
MTENTEIKALLTLIDDPDEEVYKTVSDRIISFGKEIIPTLESYWESITNEDTQERIESLIHRVHLRDLTEEFRMWRDENGSLLEGSLLVAKYHYPDMQPLAVMQEIEKLRRNMWLELNNYLTPIEKVNVLNSIFYNYYKQTGVEVSYDNPENFLVNKTLETRKGNTISNGIIFTALCELLDIPVRPINIPRQFILGYFDSQFSIATPVGHSSEKINFYIDPLSGQLFSHKDIENYFKKLSVPPVSSYFRPLTDKRIIQFLLEELSKCFDNERNYYKMEELQTLASLLDETTAPPSAES